MAQIDNRDDATRGPERELRDEWLAHVLATAPADRPTAEAAITELYRLRGRTAPRFMWVDSPATAVLAIWLYGARCGEPVQFEWKTALNAATHRALRKNPSGLRLWRSLEKSLSEPSATSLGDVVTESLRAFLDAARVDAVSEPLRDLLEASLRESLGEAPPLWPRLRTLPMVRLRPAELGQHAAPSIAVHDALNRLAVMTYAGQTERYLDCVARVTRSCGWWWPYENICFGTERPAEIHVEPWSTDTGENGVRPHHSTEPAVRYRDGWKVYAWHGAGVPEALGARDVGLADWLAESDKRLRKLILGRIGYAALLSDARAEQVQVDGSGVLWRIPDPGSREVQEWTEDMFDEDGHDPYDEDVWLVETTGTAPDGSAERRVLRVPPDARTIREAIERGVRSEI